MQELVDAYASLDIWEISFLMPIVVLQKHEPHLLYTHTRSVLTYTRLCFVQVPREIEACDSFVVHVLDTGKVEEVFQFDHHILVREQYYAFTTTTAPTVAITYSLHVAKFLVVDKAESTLTLHRHIAILGPTA